MSHVELASIKGAVIAVTRHQGMADWLRMNGVEVSKTYKHITVEQIRSEIFPGDAVVGVLPLHLAAEVCGRGAFFFQMDLPDLPPEARGKELSAEEMSSYGATLTRYVVATEASAKGSAEWDPNGTAPMLPGAKLDGGKPPVMRGVIDYFPRALEEVAKVSVFGASKYTWNGWETVPDGVARYSDADMRHALAISKGEAFDKDSKLLHMAHRAWNILATLELILRELEIGNS